MMRSLMVLAGLLASAFAWAAAPPVAGKWQGSVNGKKAVALEIQDTPTVAGSIVFYIMRDNDDGRRDGNATPTLPLRDLHWNGEVLHFAVEVGDRRVLFEMRSAGDGKAVLKRIADGDTPELTVALTAIR